MNKYNWALIFLIFIVLNRIQAQQNYHFKNFSEIEKLSNTRINDFFQDSFGFMWIATDDGLNRYDGKNVKIYKNKQGDLKSLPDNAVMQVVEDKDHNIWVACYNAIGKLDTKTDKFKKYSLDNLGFKSPPRITSALLDQEGRIWFTASELGTIRFNYEADQFIEVVLSELNDKKLWGEVADIFQLRNGLILVSDVSSGIKAYNSSTDKFDPYFLKPNYSPIKIYNIYEATDGSVWFGGSDKLIKYSPIQYSVKEINLLNYSKINSKYSDHNGIVEDSHGFLWAGVYTHGIFRFDKQLTHFDQYINNPGNLNSLPDNKIGGIFMDKYGIIWITTFMSGGIIQMDPNSNPFDLYSINLPKKNNNQTLVNNIVKSPFKDSNLLLGTNSDGILTYDTSTKHSSVINIQDASIKIDSNNSVNALAVDYQDNIWYSINNSQLKKYDIRTKKIETINSPHNNKTAQPLNIVSITVSPDNKIWICSNYGVDKYDPITKKFFSVPRIMNKKMSVELRNSLENVRNTRKPVSSILEVGGGQNLEKSLTVDNNSNVLIVSVGEGRAIGGMFDLGRIATSDGKIIWEMTDIYKSFYDGGGFKNRIGLNAIKLEKGNYQLIYSSDIGHDYKNWNTLAPSDSNYWGIEAYELNDNEYGNISELIENDLQNNNYLPFEFGRTVEFSKSNSNTIWIGTATNSFFRYDLSSNTYSQYNFDKTNLSDASHYIFSFYEDLDGIIWVGTYASLVRLNINNGELNSFTTTDGLPGGNIYNITEDQNGALWIYSSGGLSKLNKNAPIKDYSFVNYDTQDGVDGLANSTAIWKDENGRLFFGGKGGIITFIPGSINTVLPDITVHDFKIDDVSIFDDSTSFSLDQGILITDKIDLSYNQNDISFEFSAIHFSRPDKNKLSYQMEGFNSKWYETDRNFASFTNLDPGNYTFKVIGSNGDGVWNSSGRSINIIIHPPWWLTTYAYIAYGFLFLLLIFFIDRIQRRRLLSKAREKMKVQEALHRAEAAELQAKVVQAENDRKSKELEEARSLQLSMLPKELPQLPNLDIAVYMKTATEVGGDYYDFHVGMDGTLTVVLGDATGHGMKAGTMVTAVKGLFNSYSANPDILYSFREINRCIKQMQLGKLTMCLTMLKINNEKLIMSAAGMPPILIYKSHDKSTSEEVIKGMPLGSIDNFPYDVRESNLKTGDTILLMSDGLPELQNKDGEQFGYQRVRNLFENIAKLNSESIINKLKDAGSMWVNDEDPDDDVTFVVIKVK